MIRPDLSPYRDFSRADWAKLRADAPMTLAVEELDRLRALNDPVSIEEVEEIYLPLSRLLSLYVEATQGLHRATQSFLGTTDGKVPYLIGVAGSVAVGKSTTARVLRQMLRRWPNTPKVDLITTDGFLYPNAVLVERGLMDRKGFPESYDTRALLTFLREVKSGVEEVSAPVYDHVAYDILPDTTVVVKQPDIVIVEGLNVLQVSRTGVEFVSDYFDFSIYVDADERDIEEWYVARFQALRESIFRDPNSYFRHYAELSDADANSVARYIWATINGRNLRENIAPTRDRASLVLHKERDHRVSRVDLRKL
jgi:type I pantothenate kinase